MASNDPNEQQTVEREAPPKDSRPEKERLPHGGPPLLNEGLEQVRDSHC